MALIVVQARMGSTRLPGKVLKPIAGRPMLSYLIERLARVLAPHQTVVATSTGATDDPVMDFCRRERVEFTRGAELDVLARFADTVRCFPAATIVRITADCPLIDPELIDEALNVFASGRFDYVSNMIEPTWPYGMAVEAFSAGALEDAQREARDPAEREHVTPFIYWRPERYRICSLTREPNLSRHRWTVDTLEDFMLVSRVLEALYPRKPAFAMSDVLALLEQNPEWESINSHVEQKAARPTCESN